MRRCAPSIELLVVTVPPSGMRATLSDEPAVGRKFRQVMRRGGMTRENGAVGARQREADLVPVARQLRVELGKHLRRHRHHDDAGEFAVARRPAPADAEERALPHARLQDGADVSAGVARLLRQEIVAVGDAAAGRIDRGGDQRVAVFVDDQDGVDRGQCLFELVQFQMQLLLGGLDLLVGHVADQRVDGAEGEIDGLEHLAGLLGADIERGGQLLVGVREGVVVGGPAGVAERRQRDGDRRRHHDLEQTHGRVTPSAHSNPRNSPARAQFIGNVNL